MATSRTAGVDLSRNNMEDPAADGEAGTVEEVTGIRPTTTMADPTRQHNRTPTEAPEQVSLELALVVLSAWAHDRLHSHNLLPYLDSSCDVHMRGVPFRVTSAEIEQFFMPLQCTEIKVGQLEDGRASGDAIVSFNSPMEAHQALGRDRQSIGNR